MSACACSHRQAEQNRSPVTHKWAKSHRGHVVGGSSEQFSALLSSSAISPPLFWHCPSRREFHLCWVIAEMKSSWTAHTACSRPLPDHPWRLLAQTSKWTKWLGKRNVYLLLQKEGVRDAHKSPQSTFWTTSCTFSDLPVFSGHLNACKLLQPQWWEELRPGFGSLQTLGEVRIQRQSSQVYWKRGADVEIQGHRRATLDDWDKAGST